MRNLNGFVPVLGSGLVISITSHILSYWNSAISCLRMVQLASPSYGQLCHAHGMILGLFQCRARTWTLINPCWPPFQLRIFYDFEMWFFFFCNSLTQMFSEIYLRYPWLSTVKHKMLNRTEHCFIAKHSFFFLRDRAVVSCSQS